MMLQRMLWSGMRVALVFGVVLPPVVAFVSAECPKTVVNSEVCPSAPLGANCPANGATQSCIHIVWVDRESGNFGCKSKSSQNNQCVASTEEATCYTQGACRRKSGGTAFECEKDDTSGQTFKETVKVTEGC